MTVTEAAAEWKRLTEKCDVLGAYVGNVRVHDPDTFTYSFDGYIACVMFRVNGVWYDIADHTPEMGIPERVEEFKHGTIVEIYQQLRKEIEFPPEDWKAA